ncbi:chromate transporter [Microaerobacter geothermalis]|uniref:chromate transporter n=1 Tax=Microaerobacter geothermalis TaxID=674972 RepID=UPI001F47FD7A|nr:chromate transporter [Microaerobacter geothermalis]MCF6094221.1 chromate transporter [Microaerobacter geothermalis]
MTLWQIFAAFFRVGILGYGGGPSSIPLVHKEVVEKYKWMNEEEFSDVLALGNALPGPIATKMAGYIGYRVAGILGSVVGVLAMVLPTVIIMILLLGFLMSIKNSPRVQGMTNAVRPVVAVMLLVLAIDFFKKSWTNYGKWQSMGLGVFSFIALVSLNLHPAFLIGILLFYAIITKPKGETSSIPNQSDERTNEGEKGEGES